MSRELLGTPFVEGGRRPGQSIDCLGVVLEMARRRGVRFPDPWDSVAASWRAGGDIGTGFPEGWRRLAAGEQLADDDVVLLQQSGVGYVLDGYVWSAAKRVGCYCVRIDRVQPVEAWRGPRC